jgi:hypothetical protein
MTAPVHAILDPVRTRTDPTAARARTVQLAITVAILTAAVVLLVLAVWQHVQTDGPLPPSPWSA